MKFLLVILVLFGTTISWSRDLDPYYPDDSSRLDHFIELDIGGTSTAGFTINYRIQKTVNSLYFGSKIGFGLRQAGHLYTGKIALEGGIRMRDHHSIGLLAEISSLFNPNGRGSSKQIRDDFYNGPFGNASSFNPTFEETIGLGIIYRYQGKRIGIGVYPLWIRSYFESRERYSAPFLGISCSLKLNKNPNLLR